MVNFNLDTLLGTSVDKNGITVSVFLTESIGGNKRILPYFLKSYAELIEKGFSLPVLIGTNRTRAIYAVIDDEIVGAMIFELQDDVVKTTWLLLSTVSEDFRRRGIFKILHGFLEEYVKPLGSKLISSIIHKDNKAALSSSESVGRPVRFYKTEKYI